MTFSTRVENISFADGVERKKNGLKKGTKGTNSLFSWTSSSKRDSSESSSELKSSLKSMSSNNSARMN